MAESTNATKQEQSAQLQIAEADLLSLLTRKRQLEKSLSSIESSIYALEGTYLEESHYGNIVKGFQGYLTSRTDKRRLRLNEGDRVFSGSSVGYLKV